MNLPTGKQKAILGSVVNIPVDAAETVAALPRTANSSGFIPLKLKRKQSYSGHVMYRMIRPKKVDAALQYLVHNNDHYQTMLLNNNWRKDFQDENQELWDALVHPSQNSSDNLGHLELDIQQGEDDSNGEKNEDEEDAITNDRCFDTHENVSENESVGVESNDREPNLLNVK